ncbi:Fic family protein [Candidatus Saccharibacteria bacterium]|nr:Fic family protein [Candidatus Saccharibacteria bacterium]MBQ6149431.1 Fic family protein [Candidatus Saccharibacteria bacterium]
MEKYSDKIKKILLATSWSQETLASKLGVSFVSLNAWANEKSEPRDKTKQKIDLIFADVMGADTVNPEELKTTKKRALKEKCSAKKIARDRELLEKITTSLTYHSNGTEGSTMTEQDVKAVIYENQTLKNRTQTEQREAINHQTALYYLLDELVEKGPNFVFTPEIILNTHLRMMSGIISNAGLWRNHGVRVTGSKVARANYLKIPELINNWCNEANSETMDKINLLARTHAEFEKIHPFSDGNGRTGRLLLFALALKLDLIPPILYKEKREAYYKYLELANEREIYDPLELLIANSILEVSEEISE